ncbi:MAG: YicC family protein [Nitrospirae bacterium]|nr:YicC family protein [Nitrospirota bacterium]
MIRSMTGYGRMEAGDAGSHFSLEIRSLNNRYLDIQIKMPRGLAVLESRVKKTIQERFSRGRFDVSIIRNSEHERGGRLVVNEALAAQYIGILEDLKKRFELSGGVDLSLVAGLTDLITMTEEKDDPENLWQILSKGLTQALDELDRMRREEGALLAQDIGERLNTVDRTGLAIRAQVPVSVENTRKRMTETLNRLLNEQPDPLRLAQEIAVLAERTDVTEELTRLECHMTQLRSLLGGSSHEAVGRKLDFLLQEMGREVNTIASKAMDAQISMDVVNVKAELEKIREQVQNIE